MLVLVKEPNQDFSFLTWRVPVENEQRTRQIIETKVRHLLHCDRLWSIEVAEGLKLYYNPAAIERGPQFKNCQIAFNPTQALEVYGTLVAIRYQVLHSTSAPQRPVIFSEITDVDFEYIKLLIS